MTAAATGDVESLISMLAPDVVWTADSGGKASASRRPVVGAERVARVLVGLFRLAAKMPDARVKTVICNSAPALVVYSGEHLEGVFTVELVDGKITNFYAIRNPDKLAAIAIPREITR
jgi:RNA polymerase sigma-70 factor, ECF subfamily